MDTAPDFRSSRVADCRLLTPPTHRHGRDGDLTVVENGPGAPFDVKRVFYLYDVPGGADRGGHAHRTLHQFIFAVSGSFTVTLDDGTSSGSFMLNRPVRGLHVVPGIWCSLNDFSSGAIALVLCSEKYEEADYIRLFDEFIIEKML